MIKNFKDSIYMPKKSMTMVVIALLLIMPQELGHYCLTK